MDLTDLHTLEDGILFTFYEEVVKGQFDNTTSWGFVVKDKIDDVKRPRWAKVRVIGPKVKHVKVGDYVLIESLRWTNGLEYNDSKFWKTNESELIMVSEEPPVGIN